MLALENHNRISATESLRTVPLNFYPGSASWIVPWIVWIVVLLVFSVTPFKIDQNKK